MRQARGNKSTGASHHETGAGQLNNQVRWNSPGELALADYAILTASDATSPVNGQYFGSLILYGRYCVPMFWLALFRGNDLTQVQWEKGRVAAPYLMERRGICLANLAKREACIFQALPQTQRSVFAEFHRLIDQAREEYIHCDPQNVSESCALGKPFDRWLMECLVAFEGPPPVRIRSGFSAFFLGSGLSKGWQNMLDPHPKGFELWELAGASENDAFSWERNPE